MLYKLNVWIWSELSNKVTSKGFLPVIDHSTKYTTVPQTNKMTILIFVKEYM